MTNGEQIIAAIHTHVDSCGGQILCNDDRLNKKIGWVCVKCNARFSYRVITFKSESERLPKALLESFKTQESRIRLARRLSLNGTLDIEDEEEMP